VGFFVFLSSKTLHIHSKKCKHLRHHRLVPFHVVEKVGLKSYKLKLPPRCMLHPVFHCDLRSKASNSTPLRLQPVEIESDHNEYAIDFISDAKVNSWPCRRGLYLQFLTHFVGYDVPEWMLLEPVDDCKQLSALLSSNVWAQFPRTQALMLNSKLSILLEMSICINDVLSFSLKREFLSGEGCSVTAIVTPYATLVRTE